MPVVHEGRLVGIISRADIVRYVATKWAWHEAR
ncbi:MAG: CBS domain-containing protein [Chloroflexota bacterium]